MCNQRRERNIGPVRVRQRGAAPAAVSGFTLLEVLVAITILGLVLTTVYGALSRTLYAKGYAEDRAELYAVGREAVLKMADELEAALPPNPRFDVDFRTLSQGDHPPNDAVQFSINVHSGLRSVVPRSGRSTITYSLDPLNGNDKAFVLRRDEVPLTSRADAEEEDPNAPPPPKPTSMYLTDPTDCTDRRFCVAGLRLRYLDPRTSDWVGEWDSTKPDQFNQLPVAAEIALFVSDSTGGVHDFSTIVDLLLAPSALPTPTPAGNPGPQKKGP